MATRRRKLRDLIRSGQAYWLMDRNDEALAEFNRAIELDPGNARAIAHRGEIYREMQRYDEALADLSRAIDGLTPPQVTCTGRAPQRASTCTHPDGRPGPRATSLRPQFPL